MKKIILVITILTLSSLSFAQISFGPKLGYTSSMLIQDKAEIKENFKSSVHFGAYLRLGEKFYVQPEAIFMTKGAQFKKTGILTVEQNIKLKTFDVPLLFGVKLINLKVANIRVFAGPVASFVLEKTLEDIRDLPGTIPSKKSIKEMKDINWGLQFGAGVDVLFLTLDIKYEYGINNLTSNSFTEFNIDKIKNNLVLISLGYKLF